jgi:hypothetical protein
MTCVQQSSPFLSCFSSGSATMQAMYVRRLRNVSVRALQMASGSLQDEGKEGVACLNNCEKLSDCSCKMVIHPLSVGLTLTFYAITSGGNVK